jgi:hypothetical protein
MTKAMGLTAGAVVAVALLAASPAFADGHRWDDCGCSDETDNSVTIKVWNMGAIMNMTGAVANTGGNYAGGSYGGNGGDGAEGGHGGDANVDGYGLAEGGNGGEGGEGGEGGNGGPGGLVETGDATANAGSMNTVNSTDIDVEQADCGCDDEMDGWYDALGNFHPYRNGDVNNTVEIEVENEGVVADATVAGANSGENQADGSYGGNGGNGDEGGHGGEANASQGETGCGCDVYPGQAHAGNGAMGGHGGNGGVGDVGGTIRTGRAMADAGTINVVNTNLIRVR